MSATQEQIEEHVRTLNALADASNRIAELEAQLQDERKTCQRMRIAGQVALNERDRYSQMYQDVCADDEKIRAQLAASEEARKRAEAACARKDAALREIRDFRLKNLSATCPDCEELYGNKCDHGASADPIVLACDAALAEAAPAAGETKHVRLRGCADHYALVRSDNPYWLSDGAHSLDEFKRCGVLCGGPVILAAPPAAPEPER